ncbi:hypothetical protein ACFWVP_00175 [Streptomyces sp. NPDC058637]|uniref:hypothetical protein n=1 Tax=Streptomyces sp. NPDC058637 TaxID=3346569 RepID=UPI0036610059
MIAEKTDVTRPGNRVAKTVSALTGCGLLLGGVLLLLIPMGGALDAERDFRAAAVCAPGDDPAAGRDEDCLRTTAARIDRTERVTGRKTQSYWLYVTEADGRSTRTRLEGGTQDPPHAEAGESLRVTYWRDQIRYVDFGAERFHTMADPRGAYKLYCAWGLGLAFYSLVFLWTWFWWARLSRLSVRASPWHVVVPVLGALGLTAAGAFAPWVTDSPGGAIKAVGLCVPVILAVCAVVALVMARRQRGDDTIRMTPFEATGKACFPGGVLGDVPYEGRGGFLVAGPGYLASTPDMTGATLRREVPRSLRPVRVRPPYRTDPEGSDPRGLVLECDDDGVPVLIVTSRKKMPRVLGALLPTPTAGGPAR